MLSNYERKMEPGSGSVGIRREKEKKKGTIPMTDKEFGIYSTPTTICTRKAEKLLERGGEGERGSSQVR